MPKRLIVLFAVLAGAPSVAHAQMYLENAQWSPDGRHIVMNVWLSPEDPEGDIYILDADGTGLRALTDNDVPERQVSFSADGRHVYYSANVDATAAIFRVSVEGGDPERVLARDDAHLYWPEESGDGRVAVSLNPRGEASWNIAVFDPATGSLETVIADGSRNRFGNWSADGGSFVFASNRSGKDELYRADRDGTNLRQLTRYEGPDPRHGPARPRFVPGRNALVYWGDHDGNFAGDHHLNYLDLDTGEIRVLPKRLLATSYPHVSPDGNWILYTSGAGGTALGGWPFRLYVMNLTGRFHEEFWRWPSVEDGEE